ncbi:MAG: DUF362 domain-containing protein [Armatimonadota bacterium]
MSTVAVVRCDDYEYDGVQRAVQESLETAGLIDILKDKHKILLKPNLLSSRPPEHAVTTHPTVVEAIGVAARELGCELALGDSPPFAGEKPNKYIELLEKTGMLAVANRLGIKPVRFEERVVRVVNSSGRLYKSFDLAEAVMDADIIVNIAKLKNHALTQITGAVKNLFGCVPGIRKGLFHVRAAEDRETFAQMLVDLAGSIPHSIHVMDAVVAMEGEGPNAGRPRHLGLILASKDPIALDAVASAIIGLDPASIYTTRFGDEQALGCGTLENIEIRGPRIEEIRVTNWLSSSGTNDWTRIPTPIRKFLRRQLLAFPVFRAQKCVGCASCVRICPTNALKPDRPPQIDLAKCIRCYCCQEICDYEAIELRYGFLARAFRIHKPAGHDN